MAENENKGIPIPDVIDPPESMSVTLCVPKNRDHFAAFFGALYSLTEWNSWQQNGTTDGKELAAVWWRYFLSWNRNMTDIECEDGMGKCCVDPQIIKRINPTTGQVEQSSDGGSTWTPASDGWPTVIVQPVPPVTSGVAATKCDAATNVSGQVQVWIDHGISNFDTATTLLEFGLAAIAAIAAAVLAVLTDGLTIPLIAPTMAALGAALAAVWALGKTAFQDYWTTEIKDDILCAAYCNIGADGSFTDAQFSAFWNKVNSQLPPSPAKMLFMGFLSSVGSAGLNAMAASGMSADSDCGDCDCFSTCGHDWNIVANTPNYFGTLVERGEGFMIVQTDVINTNGLYYQWLWSGNADNCCYVSWEVIEGEANFTGMNAAPCGSAFNSGLSNPLGPGCFNQMQPQGSGPYTIKYTFTPCP